MQVEYDLVIDFARPSKSNTIIISEGDSNSRLCRFVLLSNKQSFDMLDVSTATVKGVKSDGSVIYGDGTIVKDDNGNNLNEVTYTLPAAVSDITGKTTMTITLMSNSGQIITSFEFYVQTRNSLYSEDDYISDSDLSGFRDLLNRSNAALEKMEAMTQAEALPNPYPLNISVANEDYAYTGASTVDIDLTDVVYLADNPDLTVDAVDETAAGIAVAAATSAQASAQAAASSATAAKASKDQTASIASDVTNDAAEAASSALAASQSAIAAGEYKDATLAIKNNINSIIDDKVTTITTQLAGAMIDDIIDDAQGYADAAQASANSASTEATKSTNEANRAEQAASSINVSATQILSSGTHIADLNVNGTVTELYAPTADTPATAAENITYNHTESGLEADNVQDAIDELASNSGGVSVTTLTNAQYQADKATYDASDNLINITDVGQFDARDIDMEDGTSVQEAIEGIDGEVSSVKNAFTDIVSDAYSSTKTYSVDDLCIYNNKLWKCKVACSGQNPSEGTYWTQTSISNIVYSIGSNTLLSPITLTANTDYVTLADGYFRAYAENGQSLLMYVNGQVIFREIGNANKPAYSIYVKKGMTIKNSATCNGVFYPFA